MRKGTLSSLAACLQIFAVYGSKEEEIYIYPHLMSLELSFEINYIVL
jgi:hypothetical protein